VRACLAILLLAASTVASSAGCEPKLLRAEALGLVRPLIELKIKDMKESVFPDGRWKGKSPHAAEVERRFEALLENRTKAGDEALAFLLNVYLGEGPGQDLVCEVSSRGRRMLVLVESYAKCVPLTGLEPLPESVRGSGALPKYARENLAKGRKCDYGK